MTNPHHKVHLIDHPLVQHKLTLMRRKDASTNTFRTLLNELSMLLAYEVTRDMPMQDIEIETPLETMTSKVIDGKKLVFVSIFGPVTAFWKACSAWCRAPASAMSACTATPKR